MATLMTIVCDRCGSEVTAGRTMLAAEAGPLRTAWARIPVTSNPTIDLCAACAQALTAWLAEPVKDPK